MLKSKTTLSVRQPDLIIDKLSYKNNINITIVENSRLRKNINLGTG